MQVKFEVETDRPHHIRFSFSKLLRGLQITLDGRPVPYETRQFSAAGWDVNQYTFTVGTTPARQVTLEKWARSGLLSTASSGPKTLLPGLLPQPLRAFVDNELVTASDHQPARALPRPLSG